MPTFTIERQYMVPVFQHITLEADTAEAAMREALDEDKHDWDEGAGAKTDYESARETYVSACWAGDEAYPMEESEGTIGVREGFAIPLDIGDPEARAAAQPVFLVQADHWAMGGRRVAFASNQAEADAQARAWVNDLIRDVHPGGDFAFDDDTGAEAPPLVLTGEPWQPALYALADAILVERGYPREATESIETLVNDAETELPCVWITQVARVSLQP